MSAAMSSLRPLAVLAPLLCAAGVALGAYASHAAAPLARERLGLAALFAFAHGLALIALASRESRLARVARCVLAAGVLLFSGSLAGAALAGLPTALAPLGGMSMIGGWLLLAIEAVRGPARGTAA
jgi:uncharacterized membrane protein YgdD (TMEM256/DUF423 family)